MAGNAEANYRRLVEFLATLDDTQTTVGLNEDEGRMRRESGATMATIAAYNELGTSKIPARPAFRQTADDPGIVGPAVEALVKTIFAAAQTGSMDKDVAPRAMHAMGETLGDALANRIDEFANPPNAALTIAKKGRDDPLVDTGRMMSSLSALTTVRSNRFRKTRTIGSR